MDDRTRAEVEAVRIALHSLILKLRESGEAMASVVDAAQSPALLVAEGLDKMPLISGAKILPTVQRLFGVSSDTH